MSYIALAVRTKWNQIRHGCSVEATEVAALIDRRLKTLILIYLWIAFTEDITIFIISWTAPDLWFSLFHHSVPAGLEVALLRRSGGQWFGFALGQAITLWQWKKRPEWLAVAAGIRFSDLFTDHSYLIAAAPSLTLFGKMLFPIFPILNLVGVVIFLKGYHQALFGRSNDV
jgi:hypothetical protein